MTSDVRKDLLKSIVQAGGDVARPNVDRTRRVPWSQAPQPDKAYDSKRTPARIGDEDSWVKDKSGSRYEVGDPGGTPPQGPKSLTDIALEEAFNVGYRPTGNWIEEMPGMKRAHPGLAQIMKRTYDEAEARGMRAIEAEPYIVEAIELLAGDPDRLRGSARNRAPKE